MRGFRTALVIGCLATANGAYASNITTGVQEATQFCLTYLETGKQSDALLRKGFKQKSKGFEKSYGRNIMLGHKNNVYVSLRNRQGKVQCLVSIGNGGAKALDGFVNAASSVTQGLGFRPGTMTDNRGRRKEVFKKADVAIRLTGKSTSGYGSISSALTFERIQ